MLCFLELGRVGRLGFPSPFDRFEPSRALYRSVLDHAEWESSSGSDSLPSPDSLPDDLPLLPGDLGETVIVDLWSGLFLGDRYQRRGFIHVDVASVTLVVVVVLTTVS